MSSDVLIPVHVQILLRDLRREVSAAGRELDSLERAINVGFDVDLGDLAAVEDLINDLDGTVRVDLDVSGAGGLDNLTQDTTFTARVNDAEIDTAVGLHNELETPTTFTASATDSEIDTAVDQHNELETPTTFTASVNDTEIQSLLTDIGGLETIQVGLDLAGLGADAVRGVGGFLIDITGVETLIEMDTLLSQIQGRAGEMIPQAERLITDLYVNGWADSRQQVAELITLASQLGVENRDIEEAARAAFTVTTVTGGDANETLRAMDQLVSLGLVDGFTEAADVIVTGFREGGNRADDLQETLVEYAGDFARLGIDGERAMTILNNGLDAGIMNTDLAADAMREFGRIMLEEVDNEEVATAIENLGLTELREDFLAGDISGETLFDAVIAGLNDIEDPAERAQVAVTLFGDMVGDFGADAVVAMGDTKNGIENVEGAAQDAAREVRDNLGTQLLAFGRTIRNTISSGLQEVVDVEGLLSDLETSIETFFTELETGAGVVDAAEVSFNLPGLSETLQTIQQVFANIGLGLLQAVSAIGSVLDFDTTGVDRLVSELGEVQLGADIFAADSVEELARSVNNAISRGVDTGTIFTELQTQFEQAVAAGDFVRASNIQQFIADMQSVVSLADEFTDEGIIAGGSWGQMFRDVAAQGQAAIEGIDIDESILDNFDPSNFGAALEGLVDAGLADAETASSFLTTIQAGINTAVASGDFSSLAGIFEVIPPGTEFAQGIQTQLEQAFTTAVQAGDFTAAQDIVGTGGVDPTLLQFSPDPAVRAAALEFAQEQAAAFGDVETATDDAATAASDFATETDTATTDASADVSTMATDTEEDLSDVETSYEDGGEAAGTFAEDTTEATTVAGEAVGEFTTVSIEELTALEDQITAVTDGFLALNETSDTTFVGIREGLTIMVESFIENSARLQAELASLATAIASVSAGIGGVGGVSIGGDTSVSADVTIVAGSPAAASAASSATAASLGSGLPN